MHLIRILSSLKACKSRAILTEDQAAEIFQIKLDDDRLPSNQRISSSAVGQLFGVSEKTVRDIWKGRTWIRERVHLDPSRAAIADRTLKRPGRPSKSAPWSESKSLQAVDSALMDDSPHESKSFQDLKDTALSCASRLKMKEGCSIDIVEGIAPQWTDSSSRRTKGLGTPLQPPQVSEELPRAHSAQHRPKVLLPDDWPRAWPVDQIYSAAPLLGSSRSDDPFHDDWRYWRTASSGSSVSS